MVNNDLNIEERWDYAFELLGEISQLISSLPDSQIISSNKFIDINNKLQKAKNLGINVVKYEAEIKLFRENLLTRKIQDKINLIQNNLKNIHFDEDMLDYAYIEQNFIEYQQDFEDTQDIENIYYQLKNIIKKAKIYRKIMLFQNPENESSFDFDQIMWEIINLKDAWIDVSDLENLIMWE